MARSRFRSVRFDLEAAIAVARIVDNAGGTIAPDLLAAGLGYSGTNNGTYLTRLANARTFGLLAGRGDRIDLTDRGRLILAGDAPAAALALRQAFLSVPLFRAVFESLPAGGTLPPRPELAVTLCRDFGESEDKAPVVAAKLLDSARQAGLVRADASGNLEVRSLSQSFTTVENRRPGLHRARVVKFRRTHAGDRFPSIAGERGGDMNDDQMWLDEGPDTSPDTGARPSPWRRAGVVAAAVACLSLVAVPVGVALTGSNAAHPAAQKHPAAKAKVIGSGPAEHEVLGALSATTDSGSFDFAYTLKSTPATETVPTTTSTTVCHTLQVPVMPMGSSGTVVGGSAVTGGAVIRGDASASSSTGTASAKKTTTKKKSTSTVSPALTSPVLPAMSGSGIQTHVSVSSGSDGSTTQTVTQCTSGPISNPGTPVSGTGISNTSPKATLIDANVGSTNGLKVSLRVDSTTLYEDLGNTLETGLAPPASQASDTGQPISGFAGITESTIGLREGAVAMIGMASPTGYLDLYQQDVNGATQTGTSTVNGVPVTVYQVAVDPTQLANEPDITTEESTTATAAVGILHAQGYTGTTDEVSIDDSGFIREVNSVAHFSDGGTVVLDVTLSNFGCAGTVLMPGQSGADTPPSGCTSPDTGLPPTAPASSATTEPPATSTTVTPTTSTVPASTTSTAPNATSTTTSTTGVTTTTTS
ncbi:MAG TPA: hypothetical protein VN799_08065 [Acidimicrobiales bacterium]|nr:hypothetical protein [Acidimicrobiales bacterium]